MASLAKLGLVTLGTLIAVNHLRRRFPMIDRLTGGGAS